MINTDKEPYRCNQTIDLEELIKMDKKETKIRATITYISGRTEEIGADLKNDGTPPKSFNNKVNAYRKFPTVVSVQLVKS